ncbi:hypothetical protein ACSBR2_011269 [Camellia fascicularis]
MLREMSECVAEWVNLERVVACSMVRDLLLTNVVVESDNSLVMKLCVSKMVPPWDCMAIFSDIKGLSQMRNVSFCWTRRSYNRVAHWLAKDHTHRSLPVNWVVLPPLELCSLLHQDIGVREEIEYIRDEFEHMTAFLRVADAMEDNNPELKVWVKQVREAAYDIGDVLELYMLRLGHRHGAGFRGFLRKVSCFIKTLKARHQIASEVQRMKSRVEEISKGHQRYHDIYGTLEQGSSSRSTGLNTACHDYRGDDLLLHESKLENIYGEFLPFTLGERLSKGILKRCEGLPLAIEAISGLLSTKDKSSVDEWDKIYRSLGAGLKGNDKLLRLNKILSLSYINLPYYLKFCFLYLSTSETWTRRSKRIEMGESGGWLNASS